MNILITGGCGYVGSILIPKLLKLNYKITSIDTQWFGNHLKKHKNLKNLKLNIQNIESVKINNIDAVIHLASIANDPMSELDRNLSWETSALGTLKLLEYCKKFRVKRFIYASSGSVYGISKENKVRENSKLEPISLYNKVKMVTEKIILSYENFFEIFIVRPATICGFSPRMRLDLTVNALTFSALQKKKIIVHGGSQVRPNVHIDDICDVYIKFLKINKRYQGIYNVGFENRSIIDIAKIVQSIIKSEIIIDNNNYDPRSYRLNSDKILDIGFFPKKNINDAIIELKLLYEKNKIKNKSNYHSLSWLKKII
jgi:nucleoside-diphosphate-sugar epimerase